MRFTLSPAVVTREIDNTTIVPAVPTSQACIAGVYRWGPVGKAILVSSEDEYAKRLGKPSNFNAEGWFTGANFLAYSSQLYVGRVAANATSAIANTGTANVVQHTILNADDFTVKDDTFSSNVNFIAKYPGELGNGLKVAVCDNPAKFKSNINLKANTQFNSANTKVSLAVGSNIATFSFANSAALTGNTPANYVQGIANTISVGDVIAVGNTAVGRQKMTVTAVSNVAIGNTAGANTGSASFTVTFDDTYKQAIDFEDTAVSKEWQYAGVFTAAPDTSEYLESLGLTAKDELHVVIVDTKGSFGPAGTVLEAYQGLSRATDAKTTTGSSNYYKTVLNTFSSYIWAGSDIQGAASAPAATLVDSTAIPYTVVMAGGTDGDDENTISIGDLASGYDMFKDSETFEVSAVLAGKARGGLVGEQMANYLIDNVSENRKDCMVFVSPDKDTVVGAQGDKTQAVDFFFTNVRSSSYAVFDSGYKYQYDKYNDVNRWIPLNGDVAGLTVTQDPWVSPAGYNKGHIKNLIKLAYSPNKAERDILYPRVNPVVTFSGQGTILFGDHTGLSRPSAFGSIGVRRTFIALEKAIARASQYVLFETNNELTRARFRNMVEPYLREIQSQGGINAFKLVCDSSNNTAEVIDQESFTADIYIKPARSINEILLNFIGDRNNSSFEEIILNR